MRLTGEGAPDAVSCGVILAAGEGLRLSTVQGLPKPATEILGLSLGERVMLACLGAGVDRFVIVLGAQAEAVRAHFERVAAQRGCAVGFVTAADWPLGNGVSTLAARDLVEDERFLLVMADHLVSASLIQQVLRSPLGPRDVGLGVDHDTTRLFDLDDAMKVEIDEGRVRRASSPSHPSTTEESCTRSAPITAVQ